MHPLAPSYARLILAGLKTIDDVPNVGTLRQDVQTCINEQQTQSGSG
ncbi:CD1375 family protein [Polycladomyces zharkentensis]